MNAGSMKEMAAGKGDNFFALLNGLDVDRTAPSIVIGKRYGLSLLDKKRV